jgi:steroid delta-isomerase-like uncharacterized protein
MAALTSSRSHNGLPMRASSAEQGYATSAAQEIRRSSDAAVDGVIDTDSMTVDDTAREFLLTLHHASDGSPCGSLRAVGETNERVFEGWIGLIGLITELRGRAMDHAATMRSIYELISAGDIDGFGNLVADDFVEHEEVTDRPPTKEGTLEFFRYLLTAFPDMQMDVDDVLTDDDKAVARVTTTATHQGEFVGVPPTGARVQMQLIDIMRFNDDGLVCEHWGVADMLSLMQQLGVVPA